MLFQFLKQNKIYTVVFVINIIVTVFVNSNFLNNFIGGESLAGEILRLCITTLSYFYIIVMACCVVHFGVFTFYNYKKPGDIDNTVN